MYQNNIIILILISIATGIIFGISFILSKKLIIDLQNSKSERIRKEFKKIGLNLDTESTWTTFIKNIDNIKRHIGTRYSFNVRVILKSELKQITYTGILWKYDDTGPSDIVLRKPYVYKTKDKFGIITTLINLKELENLVLTDKTYRDKILLLLNPDKAKTNNANTDGVAIDDIKRKIREKLEQTQTLQDFTHILHQLEFDRYVRLIVKKMQLPKETATEEDDITFIQSNDVSTLKLLSIQTLFIIKLENEKNSDYIFIPKVFQINEIELKDEPILK